MNAADVVLIKIDVVLVGRDEVAQHTFDGMWFLFCMSRTGTSNAMGINILL